jgi:hypothetical protein
MKYAVLFLLIGCGGGSAPELSEFQISTSPIVRGQPIDGTVKLRDADGLGGIEIQGELSGPASATLDVPVQGATDALTESTVGLVLLLTTAAPAGSYTASLVATDPDGMESEPVTVAMDVQ